MAGRGDHLVLAEPVLVKLDGVNASHVDADRRPHERAAVSVERYEGLPLCGNRQGSTVKAAHDRRQFAKQVRDCGIYRIRAEFGPSFLRSFNRVRLGSIGKPCAVGIVGNQLARGCSYIEAKQHNAHLPTHPVGVCLKDQPLGARPDNETLARARLVVPAPGSKNESSQPAMSRQAAIRSAVDTARGRQSQTSSWPSKPHESWSPAASLNQKRGSASRRSEPQ